VLDHVGLEATDLARSAAFYDALFHPLGGRRIVDSPEAVAYGVHRPVLWVVARGGKPSSGWGHLAITAHGRPAVDAAYASAMQRGGRDAGAPASRPAYGPSYYSAYLLDPDGHRVEVVSGSR
jgi:catechol 2,3-dioxygenase-like lactoylglutathione lyase family enzyme